MGLFGNWDVGPISDFWDNSIKPAVSSVANATGIGNLVGATVSAVKNPNNPINPTTSEPTLAQVNTTGIQAQLAKEANATATVLTGGRGVTTVPSLLIPTIGGK